MKRKLILLTGLLTLTLGLAPAAAYAGSTPAPIPGTTTPAATNASYPQGQVGSLCLSTLYCVNNTNGTLSQGNPTQMWDWHHAGKEGDWDQLVVGYVNTGGGGGSCFPWPCGDNNNVKFQGQKVWLLEYYPNNVHTGWCTINNNANNYLYQCDGTKTNQLWVDGYNHLEVAVYATWLGEQTNTILYLATTCKDCNGTAVSTQADGTAYDNWYWYTPS